MSDHIHRAIEAVGSFEEPGNDAIRQALDRAGNTIRHVGWPRGVETRGHVKDARVAHFAVTPKIGSTLAATTRGGN